MAQKYSNNDIPSINADWGKDLNDPQQRPYSNRAVQKFIKDQLRGKIGYRYEDRTNDQYLYFAEEADCQLYLQDPEAHQDLVRWSESVQRNYEAKIFLSSPSVMNVMAGTTGNYLEYTFDFVNRQGASSGDDAVVTYVFQNDGGASSTVTEIYSAGTEVKFLLDRYLVEGSNRIQINVRGRKTLAVTSQSATVNVVALEFSTEFNIAEYHEPGSSFSFYLHAKGSGIKYVETYLDGVDVTDGNDALAGLDATRLKVMTLSADIAPGIHTLQMRAFVGSGLNKYYSKTLYYTFAVTGGTAAVPLIAMELAAPTNSTPALSMEQYSSATLTYAVYDPANGTVTLTFYDGGTAPFATRSLTNERRDTVTYTPATSGTRALTVQIGAATYTLLNVTVSASEVDLSETTTGLLFKVSARGRSNSDANKDSWTYRDYAATFTGVPFNQQCGWVGDALVLSGGATVSFPALTPLAANAASSGVTVELDYSVDAGNSNDAATIVDLKNTNGNGIQITPTYVHVHSADGREIKHLTMTGTRKHMAIIVNPNAVVANKGLYMTVQDGKMGYCMNYISSSPMVVNKGLTLGDPTGTCTMRIYGIRVYSQALNVEQCLGNYAVDKGDVVGIATRNDICISGTSRLSFDKTKLRVASMRLIGDIQKLLSVQDKTTTVVVEADYYDPNDINRCWHATGVKVKNQGTSTLKFPVKNFSLDFRSAKFYDLMGSEITVSGIQLRANSVPVLRFVAKCDYMESSSSFNTSGAISFNDTARDTEIDGAYPLRTAAMQYAKTHGVTSDIRCAIDGVAIALFYQQTATSEEVCLGQYNLNNGKDDCPEVYGVKGLTGFDASKVERWELAEEGGLCAFTAAAFANFDTTYSNYFEGVWANYNPANLKRLCGWLAACDNGNGTYQQTKFNNEATSYLDLYKTAHYYIHIFAKNMGVDQVAKNMHLYTEDGVHWFPLYYDGDSAKLNDNDGYQFEDMYADRQTKDAQDNYYFQAHDSVLWNCLEACPAFMAIVAKVAGAEYSTGFNPAAEVKTYITEHTALFPERVISQNMEAKYLEPYRNGGANYLYVCQGDKAERVRLLADRRIKRYEAIWGYGGYASRALNFRLITGNTLSTEAVKVKAFDEYWFAYSSNLNYVESGVKLTAGQEHSFVIGAGKTNGDILRIHATDHMSELDMSAIARAIYSLEAVTETGALHLTKLVLGNGTDTNAVVTQINNLGLLTALTYLDVRGFSGITSLAGLENAPGLATLLATGTSLAAFAPADGVTLTRVDLPGTITDITLKDATVGTLNYTPNITLNAVSIHGCTGLNTYSLVNSWLNAIKDDAELMAQASLKLDGISWNASADFLLALSGIGTLSLRGKAVLQDDMTQQLYEALTAAFGSTIFSASSVFYIEARPCVIISAPRTTIGSGSTLQLKAQVFPDDGSKARFHMYHNGTMVEEASGYATYQGVRLNVVTGAITTQRMESDIVLDFVAYTSSIVSNELHITVSRTVPVTSFEVLGQTTLKELGETGYSVVGSPADATIRIASIEVEIIEL